MLTIRTCKAFSKALGEYLRQADYYAEGMKVEGHCYGRLCKRVGLTESAIISDQAFERIASNHHATTGEQLTERMAAGRRAGYDATFNAPKSVSIQAFVGGDERLIAAHETAVHEALRELEAHACHQEGRGVNKRYVTSGEIAAAVFRHGESRALDPHLHSHAFIFNVTRSDSNSGRLLALESSNIFERTKYLTEVYRNTLAREVQQLGYQIERRANGFELTGVAPNLLERFSKRAQQRDQAISVREAELGRELSRDEIAILVRENRAQKQYELTSDEVRQRQLAQVNESELEQLRVLKSGSPPVVPEAISLQQAIARAVEHVFERKTVVPEYEFIAEIIRQSYGTSSVAELKTAIASGVGGLLQIEGQVSTQGALDLERALVEKLNTGVGVYDGQLGYAKMESLWRLSLEQQEAVKTLLGSVDRVSVLRGRAGTGKTHTLATAIEGITNISREVACFAPSTQAVDILKLDGIAQQADGRVLAGQALRQTETIQRLLVDSALQQSIHRKAVIVDEYGLLSTRQLKQLVDIAETQDARLVLVGDSGQHKSVEAGDAARIVEKESRVRVAELKEVRRQAANPAYKVAAEDLAAGRIDAGLQKLDRMEAIVEIENPSQRRAQMVDEWFRITQETKSVRTRAGIQERAKTALMVAPTWAEIDALTTHARQKLRNEGKIAREDQSIASLRAKDWTKAQQKDVRNYQPGDILVAHKTTKHFQKNDELRVVRKEKGRLVVARGEEQFSVSSRQSGLAWTVCEERPMAVAAGDKVRLRAVAHVEAPDGQRRRLANGTTLTVRSVDVSGRLVLADGSVLSSRQIVHGYAMTSHAAQGVTVDKVFIAGATSREGLYVSATRGREGIRIFVSDREAFLDGAGLQSEARTSAIEFARRRAVIRPEMLNYIARAWQHLRHCIVAHFSPWPLVVAPAEEIAPKLAPAPSVRVEPQFPAPTPYRHSHNVSPSVSPTQGTRMRL